MKNVRYRVVWHALVAAGAGAIGVGAAGCRLPTVPSELTKGIAVYEHVDFAGRSGLIANSISDLDDKEGPCEAFDAVGGTVGILLGGPSTKKTWDDCISSIRLSPGTRAIVYLDPNFRGASYEVTVDLPNLVLADGGGSFVSPDVAGGRLNDEISSIRIIPQ